MEKNCLPQSVLVSIAKEARQYFRNARGSHDWDHTERVDELCQRIGRKEKADLVVLKLAALLHDIGREEEDRTNGKICHGEKGAELAKGILARHGVPAEMAGRVIHCIESHRFRRNKTPQTLEAKILFDADKLDSIGAVGIGRAFLFAGEVGARLHNAKVDVLKTRPYTKEDTAYREFRVKLHRVKNLLYTREGKRIARDRHKFMVLFFNRLASEIKGVL